MKTIPQIRALLWSMLGSGEHYHGPATYSYRVFSRRDAADLSLSLAHGYPAQANYDLFDRQFLVSPSEGVWNRVRFIWKGIRWMREHAREFDIVHGISAYHYSVRPCFEACQQDVATVLFVSNERSELTDKRGIKSLLGLPKQRRQMVKQFDAVIALSSAIRDELMEYGVSEERIANIPNFADVDRFCPIDVRDKATLRDRLGLQDLPTIVFVGRLSARKQPHYLVNALKFLEQHGIEAQLALVGPYDGKQDQTYIAKLRHLIDEQALVERVHLPGFCNNVAEWLQAADVFSLPSIYEGMPGALVEALSCGLPAVVTPFSGAQDVVNSPVLGSVVEDSQASVERALLDLLRDRERLDVSRQACRKRIVSHFSAESVYAQHLKLFQCVLAGEAPRQVSHDIF